MDGQNFVLSYHTFLTDITSFNYFNSSEQGIQVINISLEKKYTNH